MIYDKDTAPWETEIWFFNASTPIQGKIIDSWRGSETSLLVEVDGSQWGYGALNAIFADTREELLVHAISQQKGIIEKAELEINRLQAMREVPLVEQ